MRLFHVLIQKTLLGAEEIKVQSSESKAYLVTKKPPTFDFFRSTASVVIRNDGDSAVYDIQLAADALNVNRLIYLNAKADNKRLTISKDYKVYLEKVRFICLEKFSI